mmetsp:Transcript_6743/g.23030  ORF Transcript_6743/g.23030 Transcript_6743/m.23030 type:complete len:272 (+) Transcript_6743:1331-2146(+)
MGDDWEDDEFEVPNLAAPQQQPPESWSDEEAHDAKQEDAARDQEGKDAKDASPGGAGGPPAPARPKQLAKQKIAEREAKEREMAAKAAKAKAAKADVVFGDDRGILDGARGADDTPVDAVAEKLRLRQLEEEADFENAQGMFDAGRGNGKAAAAPDGEAIESFVARTAADGEQLADRVALKLTQFEHFPWYTEMCKALVKKLTANASADDVKELASTVQVVANDKLKAERDKHKGKKKAGKGKATVKETHNAAFDNTDEYGDNYDDEYDFM